MTPFLYPLFVSYFPGGFTPHTPRWAFLAQILKAKDGRGPPAPPLAPPWGPLGLPWAPWAPPGPPRAPPGPLLTPPRYPSLSHGPLGVPCAHARNSPGTPLSRFCYKNLSFFNTFDPPRNEKNIPPGQEMSSPGPPWHPPGFRDGVQRGPRDPPRKRQNSPGGSMAPPGPPEKACKTHRGGLRERLGALVENVEFP